MRTALFCLITVDNPLLVIILANTNGKTDAANFNLDWQAMKFQDSIYSDKPKHL